MRNCSRARAWFGAYWDDEITQAEREWLEAHFAACPKCRSEYDVLARTLESVATLPRIEAAPDFTERTLARVRRATPAADRLALPRPAWQPVAVAASLLVIAGTLLAPFAGRLAQGPIAHRMAPPEARLVATPAPGSLAAREPAPAVAPSRAPQSQEQVAALVDSLIDHGEDVDFVLDPVRVGHERTASRRLEPAQGRQAVISF